VLWYAVIFAFRSTFSIKYFQHAHGLDLATAGAMNSYVFLAAMFTTPAFGWLCDKIGRYAPMLAFGALLLPVSSALLYSVHERLRTGPLSASDRAGLPAPRRSLAVCGRFTGRPR
jgi:nitrate/nitrite transporter NarK